MVLEQVRFYTLPEHSHEVVMATLEPTVEWARHQPGFVHRFLLRPEGPNAPWVDHVIWSSMAEAEAAMKASQTAPAFGPLMSLIDMGRAFEAHHAEIALSSF